MFSERILVHKLSFTFPTEEFSSCCLLRPVGFVAEMLLECGFAVEVSVTLTAVELGGGMDGGAKVLV